MTDLLQALLAEHQPASTLERHLTAQLAHVLAKQTEAEDNETSLLARQPQYLLTHRPDGHLVPDPAYLIYNNRLDAKRRHQVQLGREQSRILRELHRLKRTPLAVRAASEPGVANQNRASEPTASFVTPRSGRAMTEVVGTAKAADEPGVVVGAPASEPKSAASGIASEPNTTSAGATTEPAAHAAPAKEPRIRPANAASEPRKPAHVWPVLSDAEADRIEAMIHSGDAGQLEEAARLLGIMDPNAPVPPHILALAQSKLAS